MQIVMTPMFWVLMVVWGCGSGMFNALLTLLPQILCPYGYSDVSPPLTPPLPLSCSPPSTHTHMPFLPSNPVACGVR